MREHEIQKLRIIPPLEEESGKGSQAVSLFNEDGSPFVFSENPVAPESPISISVDEEAGTFTITY